MQFEKQISNFERGSCTFHEHCDLLGIEVFDVLLMDFANMPDIIDKRYVYLWDLRGKRICCNVTFAESSCFVDDPTAVYVSFYNTISRELYFASVSKGLEVTSLATVDRPGVVIHPHEQGYLFEERICSAEQVESSVHSVLCKGTDGVFRQPVESSYFSEILAVLEPSLVKKLRFVAPCYCYSVADQRKCDCSVFVVGRVLPLPGHLLTGTHWDKYQQLQELVKRHLAMTVWNKRFKATIPHFVKAVCGVVGYPRYAPGVLHFSNEQVIVDVSELPDLVISVRESRPVRVVKGSVFRVEGYCQSLGSNIFRIGGTKVAHLRKEDDQLGFVTTFLSRFIILSTSLSTFLPLPDTDSYLLESIFKSGNVLPMSDFVSFFSVLNISLSLASFQDLVERGVVSLYTDQGKCYVRRVDTVEKIRAPYVPVTLPEDFNPSNLQQTYTTLLPTIKELSVFILDLKERYPTLTQSMVILVMARAFDARICHYSMAHGHFYISCGPALTEQFINSEELFEIFFCLKELPTVEKEFQRLVQEIFVDRLSLTDIQNKLVLAGYHSSASESLIKKALEKNFIFHQAGYYELWPHEITVRFKLDGLDYGIVVDPGTKVSDALKQLQDRLERSMVIVGKSDAESERELCTPYTPIIALASGPGTKRATAQRIVRQAPYKQHGVTLQKERKEWSVQPIPQTREKAYDVMKRIYEDENVNSLSHPVIVQRFEGGRHARDKFMKRCVSWGLMKSENTSFDQMYHWQG